MPAIFSSDKFCVKQIFVCIKGKVLLFFQGVKVLTPNSLKNSSSFSSRAHDKAADSYFYIYFIFYIYLHTNCIVLFKKKKKLDQKKVPK